METNSLPTDAILHHEVTVIKPRGGLPEKR
jgi:hypothetical protein